MKRAKITRYERPDHLILDLEKLKERHGAICLILAPPRSCSTALARVFWGHAKVGYYCHEPFDAVYHRRRGLEAARRALHNPLVVRRFGNSNDIDKPGVGLVVKEMTFQLGEHFLQLAAATTTSIVFLLRDPRLTISSRMKRRQEEGQDSLFPRRESGWEDIAAQVSCCQEENLPYVLVDATDLRNHPEFVLKRLFERLSLTLSASLLHWDAASNVRLGSLDGEQDRWYERVLTSRGLLPETKAPPPLDSFPTSGGFRKHVEESVRIYERLLRDDKLITPGHGRTDLS